MELIAKNVTKQYGKKIALQDVSFTISEGIYGLLGPNGSGKSTLINLITTNTTATKGSFLWNGKEINSMGKSYREVLGYVPQQLALYPDFQVYDFMEYLAILKEIKPAEREEEISRCLQKVQLEEMSRFKIRMLSGGMKQRLLIAQALMGNPKLLIMDEPTVGLDPKQRQLLKSVIKSEMEGKIIIIATHIVSDLEEIADQIILVKKGNILKIAEMNELMEEVRAQRQSETCTLDEVYIHYFGEEDEENCII